MEQILNGKRFDLFAKYIYAKYYILRINTTWHIDLYKNHILVFNGAWENPGTKTNVEDFIESFNSLIDSVVKTGYDMSNKIIVNKDNMLTSGAHRFISGLLLDINVPVIQKDFNFGGDGYNHDFFSRRINYGIDYLPVYAQKRVLNSMEKVWMNEMALEACKRKSDTKVITIFPIADTKHDLLAIQLIKNHGTIIYTTEIYLNDQGLLRYICELYLGEKWVGYTRKDKALDTKGIFPTRIVIYTPNQDDDTRILKSQLRKIYGTNNSVHMNDTQEEAIRYAQSALHSVQYLNYGHDLSEKNQEMFERYKKLVQNTNNEYFCIDSSFVMSFYGLRDAKDLDYLHFRNHLLVDDDIHSHNSEAKYYDQTIDDIIFNPKLHFYVNGCKVARLEVVNKMKQNRDEEKDKMDILLINSIM